MPIEALSATLMSFAAGALAEPLSAACSVHVSMCAQCRSELRDMELLGATLVGSTPTGGGRVGPPIKPHEAQLDAHRGAGEVNADDLPLPLARRYDLALDQIPWKRLLPVGCRCTGTPARSSRWCSPAPLPTSAANSGAATCRRSRR